MLANDSHLPAHTQSPVLCVDLDGSLLATDMLWESMLLTVKSRPSLGFSKQDVGRRVALW